MLHPLLLMAILTVVFSHIMNRSMQDYAIFLFCGLLPWQFFSTTVTGSLDAIRSNLSIMEQVPIPKFIFSLSKAFSELINFVLSIVPLIFLMIILGRDVSWTVLALPLVLFPLFLLSIGLALLFSATNVFFEDIRHLSSLLFRGLFYLTPIIYSRNDLPEALVNYLVFNPMFHIVEFMRDLFYHGMLPELSTYLISLAVSLLILAVGLWVFKKTEDKFVYFI
jgi:ABC-2 type transport system permease protein